MTSNTRPLPHELLYREFSRRIASCLPDFLEDDLRKAIQGKFNPEIPLLYLLRKEELLSQPDEEQKKRLYTVVWERYLSRRIFFCFMSTLAITPYGSAHLGVACPKFTLYTTGSSLLSIPFMRISLYS